MTFDFSFRIPVPYLVGLEVRLGSLLVARDDESRGVTIEGASGARAAELRSVVDAATRDWSPAIGVRLVFEGVPLGESCDLVAAVAVLAARGEVPRSALESAWFWGGLRLDGSVRPIRGAVPVVRRAHDVSMVYVSAVDEPDLRGFARAQGLSGVRSIRELRDRLRGVDDGAPDFGEIIGNARARRAAEVSAAGGHSLALLGDPGSGRTMLARRIVGILPPMTRDERVEAAELRSIAGLDVSGSRPFRAPHHTVSAAGLLGGGVPVRPGEVSLAHGGVLFLDELDEFRASIFEDVRRAVGRGVITVHRGADVITFPACPLLVGALARRGCCGFRECLCPPERVEAAALRRERLFGPAFEIRTVLEPAGRAPEPAEPAESSSSIRERVFRARSWLDTHPDPHEDPSPLHRVARTIAALDTSERILTEHFEEARELTRAIW